MSGFTLLEVLEGIMLLTGACSMIFLFVPMINILLEKHRASKLPPARIHAHIPLPQQDFLDDPVVLNAILQKHKMVIVHPNLH